MNIYRCYSRSAFDDEKFVQSRYITHKLRSRTSSDGQGIKTLNTNEYEERWKKMTRSSIEIKCG